MKKEHPGVPGGGALRAKEAMEWIMKTVFLVCGFIAIAFVLLITVYLSISGPVSYTHLDVYKRQPRIPPPGPASARR